MSCWPFGATSTLHAAIAPDGCAMTTSENVKLTSVISNRTYGSQLTSCGRARGEPASTSVRGTPSTGGVCTYSSPDAGAVGSVRHATSRSSPARPFQTSGFSNAARIAHQPISSLSEPAAASLASSAPTVTNVGATIRVSRASASGARSAVRARTAASARASPDVLVASDSYVRLTHAYLTRTSKRLALGRARYRSASALAFAPAMRPAASSSAPSSSVWSRAGPESSRGDSSSARRPWSASSSSVTRFAEPSTSNDAPGAPLPLSSSRRRTGAIASESWSP